MQSCSNTIGALASALAKAQAELSNPEKSLTATLPGIFPREESLSPALREEIVARFRTWKRD